MTAIDSARALEDRWRETHLGRLLGHAMRRFDARVLQLMASNEDVPLALSNLAARDQISAAHVHITRHLALQGSRLTELAKAA
ncbi:MAG: MarR family transcriptional regulator, partial [Betaproteobacteria bacterium]|nr:MarR family transcriptional regulator [Betaproteobacteria bacterium]